MNGAGPECEAAAGEQREAVSQLPYSPLRSELHTVTVHTIITAIEATQGPQAEISASHRGGERMTPQEMMRNKSLGKAISGSILNPDCGNDQPSLALCRSIPRNNK